MTDTEIVTLRFSVPDKHSKGFLRRARKAAAFSDAVKSGQFSEKTVIDMAEFFTSFVIGDATPEQVLEFVYDASEEEILGILGSVGGAGADAEVPPA